MSLVRIIQLSVLSLGGLGAFAAAADRVDYSALAHDHFYNLEYDEAVEAGRRLVEQRPNDLIAHTDLATSILFKELLRLGKLETKAFKDDKAFFVWEKPEPDAKVAEEFKRAMLRGREIAETALDRNPNNPIALYALATNYGMDANYRFMVKNSYFGALRTAGRADEYSRKLIKRHPDFIDGYLVAGTHEYVIGSLPWTVRYMIAIGGIRGSKKKGKEYVTRVAREGDLARDAARALLILLLRRERRPLEAVEFIESLIRDYPRNYLMHLELARLDEDAGKEEEAIEIFRRIQAKVKSNEDRFGRMPARAQEALDRKIAEFEQDSRRDAGGS